MAKNEPKIETRRPGEFVAGPIASIQMDNGKLHPDAAHNGDGTLLRRGEDDLLHEWTGSGVIVGVLLQPDRAEIESTRNRVVLAGHDLEINPDKIRIPSGFEEEAAAGLTALGFKWGVSFAPITLGYVVLGSNGEEPGPPLIGADATDLLRHHRSGTILVRDAHGRFVAWKGEGTPAGVLLWPESASLVPEPAQVNFTALMALPLDRIRIPAGLEAEALEALGPDGIGVLVTDDSSEAVTE